MGAKRDLQRSSFVHRPTSTCRSRAWHCGHLRVAPANGEARKNHATMAPLALTRCTLNSLGADPGAELLSRAWSAGFDDGVKCAGQAKALRPDSFVQSATRPPHGELRLTEHRTGTTYLQRPIALSDGAHCFRSLA